MSIPIGDVISVFGVEVSIKAFESSNLETHFHDGKRFKGVSIREFIAIEHGFREIVCTVEGEYLDESKFETEGANRNYIRKLKARPFGYFEDGSFKNGIKFLPKIGDTARLLSEDEVRQIYERDTALSFRIGKLLTEDLPVTLPWDRIFNSHLGIFGNTGSGKSNTLTKLYTVLFDNKLDAINSRSKFVFLDFNGEYTGTQLSGPDHKSVIRLNTRSEGGDKFALLDKEFWDAETLGILFQATANTQRPFLRRIVTGRERFLDLAGSLTKYVGATFRRVLTSNAPSAEALELVRTLARSVSNDGQLTDVLSQVSLQSGAGVTSFHVPTPVGWKWLANDETFYIEEFDAKFKELALEDISGFEELQIRANLQIIRDVLSGSAQYEHIQPLLRRIEAFKGDFTKVIEVRKAPDAQATITVISLRDCKQDVKKILPILIAKHYYEQHKDQVASPPTTTLHLVIDEAHNILSQQSNREAESWKDYRLELFEEIIKEGRKFGIFITLASQRPADISPTIVSQLHNYFIHRLVNDRDLALLENTISTLDSISRSQIPMLPQGACVVTGTSFEIPMLMQIDKLPSEREPDSSDVSLNKIWE
jgi:uncharacterized protein